MRCKKQDHPTFKKTDTTGCNHIKGRAPAQKENYHIFSHFWTLVLCKSTLIHKQTRLRQHTVERKLGFRTETGKGEGTERGRYREGYGRACDSGRDMVERVLWGGIW